MGRKGEESKKLTLSSLPITITTNNHNIKENSIKIWRLLLCLVVFVSGVLLGLVSTSHLDLNLLLFSSSPSSSHNIYPTASHIFPIFLTNNSGWFESFVHPEDLQHKMSDDELYWRASMVPRITEYPFKRVEKVAFMFLTRGPLPFLPLWERFFAGHQTFFSIYVHALPGFLLDVSPDSVFFGRQIPSKKVSWGDVSLADAEKRLLANALLDFSNERFVLLSESCIPVFKFNTVYKYLMESNHSFVESYDDPSHRARGRYHRRMGPEIQIYQWRKGSQWFEMSRTLAVEIISDYKYYDLFRKYCHPSCYPDEHYIPTYINMFHAALNSNRTITYVDWSMLGPHPATFNGENTTESLIRNIRVNRTECWYNFRRTTICYLFARKFAPSALEPLLNISSKVMGF